MVLTAESTGELSRIDSESEIIAGAAAAVANELTQLIVKFGGPSDVPTPTRTSLSAAQSASNAIDRNQSIGDAIAHLFNDLNTNVQTATAVRPGIMSPTQAQQISDSLSSDTVLTPEDALVRVKNNNDRVLEATGWTIDDAGKLSMGGDIDLGAVARNFVVGAEPVLRLADVAAADAYLAIRNASHASGDTIDLLTLGASGAHANFDTSGTGGEFRYNGKQVVAAQTALDTLKLVRTLGSSIDARIESSGVTITTDDHISNVASFRCLGLIEGTQLQAPITQTLFQLLCQASTQVTWKMRNLGASNVVLSVADTNDTRHVTIQHNATDGIIATDSGHLDLQPAGELRYDGTEVVKETRLLSAGTAITVDGGASGDLSADRTIAVNESALTIANMSDESNYVLRSGTRGMTADWIMDSGAASGYTMSARKFEAGRGFDAANVLDVQCKTSGATALPVCATFRRSVSGGAGAAGLGLRIPFQIENSLGTTESEKTDAVWLDIDWDDATDGSEDAAVAWQVSVAGTMTERFRLNSAGIRLSAPLVDANDNELVEFTSVASAINHLGVHNAASGGDAMLTANTTGAEADANLRIEAKQEGAVICGSSNASAGGQHVFQKLYDNGTKTTNFDIDWNNGNMQKVTVNSGGALTVGFLDPQGPGTFKLMITQGANPSTLTFSDVDWGDVGAPTWATTNGDRQWVGFHFRDEGPTTYDGFEAGRIY